MTLDEIQNAWEKDGRIDVSELGQASIDVPALHNKYWKMFSAERLRLRKLEADFKAYRLRKFEFYTMGPNEATPEGWELPPQGRVLKNEANQYIEADPGILEAQLKIDYQKEKVSFLESILDTISRRSFHIKNAIEFLRFQNGT
jgi:hypothetical protein